MHQTAAQLLATLIIVAATSPSVFAGKAEVWKPPTINEDTGSIEHALEDITWLASVDGVTILHEYPTTILLEVDDDARETLHATAAANDTWVRDRPEFDVIHINGYRFPAGTVAPIEDPRLRLDDYHGTTGLYLVQLVGPNTAAWEAVLRAHGTIIHYYPENTYLIAMQPDIQHRILDLAFVQHVGPHQPAFKLAPELLTTPDHTTVWVQLIQRIAATSHNETIQRLLSTVDSQERERVTITATLTLDEILTLAHDPGVLWVEPTLDGDYSDERVANVVADKHNGSQPTNPGTYHTWLANTGFCTSTSSPPGCWNYWSLVGLFDSGLDENVCAANGGTCMGGSDTRDRHLDLGAREKYFHCDGCYNGTVYVYSDDRDHGTKVASIIAGDPQSGTGDREAPSSYFLGSGIAPLARLATVKLGDRFGFYSTYDAGDFEGFVNFVRTKGGRIITNSWNYYSSSTTPGGDPNRYNVISQVFDELVRDASGGYNQFNQPMTIVFSAGNTSSGPANTMVLAPANAKNVVSVGSSQSYRPSPSAYDCDDATNIKNISEYSRRDVQYDTNRYKPDFVAPGTSVAAAQSQEGDSGDGYDGFSGTSAAAPVVTGAAVLADVWYYYNHGSAKPSPAMIKALLAAHADDLRGGTDEVTGLTIGAAPQDNQGWGRVNLNNLFQTSHDVTVFDEDHTAGAVRRFTAGEGSWTVALNVDDTTEDVIIALAFTDAPAATTAYALRVNDLDLYAIDGAYSYQGNNFNTNGYSHRATGHWFPDNDNTIELIRIPAGDIVGGDFTIEVVPSVNAVAVPGLDNGGANQDFALYVYNAS